MLSSLCQKNTSAIPEKLRNKGYTDFKEVDHAEEGQKIEALKIYRASKDGQPFTIKILDTNSPNEDMDTITTLFLQEAFYYSQANKDVIIIEDSHWIDRKMYLVMKHTEPLSMLHPVPDPSQLLLNVARDLDFMLNKLGFSDFELKTSNICQITGSSEFHLCDWASIIFSQHVESTVDTMTVVGGEKITKQFSNLKSFIKKYNGKQAENSLQMESINKLFDSNINKKKPFNEFLKGLRFSIKPPKIESKYEDFIEIRQSNALSPKPYVSYQAKRKNSKENKKYLIRILDLNAANSPANIDTAISSFIQEIAYLSQLRKDVIVIEDTHYYQGMWVLVLESVELITSYSEQNSKVDLKKLFEELKSNLDFVRTSIESPAFDVPVENIYKFSEKSDSSEYFLGNWSGMILSELEQHRSEPEQQRGTERHWSQHIIKLGESLLKTLHGAEDSELEGHFDSPKKPSELSFNQSWSLVEGWTEEYELEKQHEADIDEERKAPLPIHNVSTIAFKAGIQRVESKTGK